MKKLLLIYNPGAGTGKGRSALPDVIEYFSYAGFSVEVYPTQHAGDGRRKILDDAAAFDRIVVAGGDGMIHEAVGALVQHPHPTPLAVLPCGTINDFAATHGIPKKIRDAAKIAVTGHPQRIDVGCFNEQIFSYVAAFGMVTHVSYETKQVTKNKLGRIAYGLEILKSIDLKHFDAASRQMRIASNRGVIVGKFIFGAITNSKYMGGIGKFFPEDVKTNDGLLEGLFIRRPNTIVELEQLKRGLIENDLTAPCIIYHRSASFSIKTHSPMDWTLDGEKGGGWQNVSINTLPQALPLMLPSSCTE